MKLRSRWLTSAGVCGLGLLSALGVARLALSSDHADTPQIAASPGTDITDVFVFPSPTNANNVVLTMCVSPLIPKAGAATRQFDPNVLYQFKIDNNNDAIEDLVIQAKFDGTGTGQAVSIVGPAAPRLLGNQTKLAAAPYATVGTLGSAFSPTSGMQVFAGPREDPFFFDLEQFFAIFPDRATPISGVAVAEPNKPLFTTWRAASVAKDFLTDLNLLAIVVELPKSAVRGTANGQINVWCTTSN
jgi:hypothetical protein